MIYICLPVHDEGPTLGPLMWKIRRLLTDPEFRRDFHVLVLDDASTDDTPAVLDRYRKVLPMTVIRSDERLGYGRAVDRLLREAVERAPYPKRDAAVVLQADFTDDPSFVVDLVKTFEGGADVVSGVTDDAVSGESPGSERWSRRLAPLLLGRAWGRAPVSDPLCGYRAYRIIVLKKALRDEAPLCESPEVWAAALEVLARVTPHARRIEQAPHAARPRLRARDSRFRAVPTLKALFGLRGRTSWPAPTEEAS